MKPETADALDESIVRWTWIVQSGHMNHKLSWRDCALCGLYYQQDNQCNGCPVMAKTGRRFCARTPYEAVRDIKERSFDTSRFQAAATREVVFLKSLREPTE